MAVLGGSRDRHEAGSPDVRELHPTIEPLRDPRPPTHENLVGNDHPTDTRGSRFPAPPLDPLCLAHENNCRFLQRRRDLSGAAWCGGERIMDSKGGSILGICIIIAAAIVVFAPHVVPRVAPPAS